MKESKGDYSQFVEHPRYGRRPRITGLNPDGGHHGVHFHWHSSRKQRIPDTAIKANLGRQKWFVYPVTHYFDVKRQCRDCGRPFLFFAEEQRHWYEKLGFSINADCVRCPICRKKTQGIARLRERYVELLRVPKRNIEQTLELADCCLSLINKGAFTAKQFQYVRRTLNQVPKDHRKHESYLRLRARMKELEEKTSR